MRREGVGRRQLALSDHDQFGHVETHRRIRKETLRKAGRGVDVTRSRRRPNLEDECAVRDVKKIQ